MNPQALAWIEDQKSNLVAAAIDNTPPGKVTKSQLQTLLSVAHDEPLDVLRSHLRYQMGRKNAWKDWDAGVKILAMLDREVTKRYKSAIAAKHLDTVDARDQRAIQRRLAALLIGYVIREHTYRSALTKQQMHDRSKSDHASGQQHTRGGSR